jgi:hypothetical protein
VKRAKAALPLVWYRSIEAQAFDWQVHPTQVLYYLSAGLLQASALVPKSRLPEAARRGAAPCVCIVLDFRALEWSHTDRGSIACLLGEYQAFSVNGEQFATVPVELTEPVAITHADLVILDAEREACEARNTSSRPRYTNTAEQRATALMVCTLAAKAYGSDAMAHHYRTAARIVEQIELGGAKLSRESVANKLKVFAQLATNEGFATANV